MSNTADPIEGLDWIEKTETRAYSYIFKTPLGLHYEDTSARDFMDQVVAHRIDIAIEGVVLGAFPDLGEPIYSNGEVTVTRISTPVEKIQWVWKTTSDTPTDEALPKPSTDQVTSQPSEQ